MASKKTTWCEKLQDSKGHPTVGPVTGKMSQRWGTGTIVIPAPIEVDEIESVWSKSCARFRKLITQFSQVSKLK